jgi:hypothetical protein
MRSFDCSRCGQEIINRTMAEHHNDAICDNYMEMVETMKAGFGPVDAEPAYRMLDEAGLDVGEILIQAKSKKATWHEGYYAWVTKVRLAKRTPAMIANLFQTKVLKHFISRHKADPSYMMRVEQAGKISPAEAINFVHRDFIENKLDPKSLPVRRAINQLFIDTACMELTQYKITEGFYKNMVAVTQEDLDCLLISIQTLRDFIDGFTKRKS